MKCLNHTWAYGSETWLQLPYITIWPFRVSACLLWVEECVHHTNRSLCSQYGTFSCRKTWPVWTWRQAATISATGSIARHKHANNSKLKFTTLAYAHNLLQGDAYTGNWLSAIRHTPKLARRMIVSTMSLVAELYPDKTHVLYGPRHAVIHCNTLPHCNIPPHLSVNVLVHHQAPRPGTQWAQSQLVIERI